MRVEKIRTIGDGYLATVGVFEDYHRDKASRRTNRDSTSRVADALDFGKRVILRMEVKYALVCISEAANRVSLVKRARSISLDLT
ncbi:adenylate cyclase [Pseudoscourfieldia marina]